jgi:hypothetical protein
MMVPGFVNTNLEELKKLFLLVVGGRGEVQVQGLGIMGLNPSFCRKN